MTESTTPGIDAGQMIIETIRHAPVNEVWILSQGMRKMKDHAMSIGHYGIAELFHVLSIAADHLLADHPDALTPRDLADLDALPEVDDTPEPDSRDV